MEAPALLFVEEVLLPKPVNSDGKSEPVPVNEARLRGCNNPNPSDNPMALGSKLGCEVESTATPEPEGGTVSKATATGPAFLVMWVEVTGEKAVVVTANTDPLSAASAEVVVNADATEAEVAAEFALATADGLATARRSAAAVPTWLAAVKPEVVKPATLVVSSKLTCCWVVTAVALPDHFSFSFGFVCACNGRSTALTTAGKGCGKEGSEGTRASMTKLRQTFSVGPGMASHLHVRSCPLRLCMLPKPGGD